MGIGTWPRKTSKLEMVSGTATSKSVSMACTGMRTPHSQFRHVSLGPFVVLSLTSLPQALSERFAEPTYAQARQRWPSVDVDDL